MPSSSSSSRQSGGQGIPENSWAAASRYRNDCRVLLPTSTMPPSLSLSLSRPDLYGGCFFFRLASIQLKTKCEHRWLVRGPEKYMGGKTEMKGGTRGFKQKTAALPQFSRRGEWPLLNKMGAIPPLPIFLEKFDTACFYCVRWRRKGKGGSRPYANIAPTLLMNEL